MIAAVGKFLPLIMHLFVRQTRLFDRAPTNDFREWLLDYLLRL
jgi:hypothetical protein